MNVSGNSISFKRRHDDIFVIWRYDRSEFTHKCLIMPGNVMSALKTRTIMCQTEAPKVKATDHSHKDIDMSP